MTNYTEDGLYESDRPRHSETVDSGTSDALVLYPKESDTSVVVSIGTATSARVEYTLSPLSDVENDGASGADADWFPWDDGDVSTVTRAAFAPGIVAMRLVATGGTATWYVCQ